MKTTFIVDWDALNLDVELQELFFNINSTLLYRHMLWEKPPEVPDEKICKEVSALKAMMESAFPGPLKAASSADEVSLGGPQGLNFLASMFGGRTASSESPASGAPPRRKMRRGKTVSQAANHPRRSYTLDRKWEPAQILEILNRTESVLHLAKQENTLFYPSIELGSMLQKIMITLHKEMADYFQASESESLFGRVLMIEKDLPSFAREIAEVIMRITYGNKYILGLFSSTELIKYFECMPIESTWALLYVEDTKPFRRDFKKLLEVYYRWATETINYWSELKEDKRTSFYHLSISIFTFFNQMILQERAEDPNVIEKELPYFDVLFSIYHLMYGSTVLEYYSGQEHQVDDEHNINHLHIERCQLILGLKLGADSGTRVELIKSSHDPKFDMLLYLLHSMGLASKRFLITDTSHTVRRNMCTFMTDILTFVDKHIPLTQMSLDEEKAELVVDKTIIFQGYSQLVARENQVVDAIESAAAFVADANGDKTLHNKYAVALLPVILNLQNHLAFSYEECLLDLDTEETLLETKSGSTLHRAATEDSVGENAKEQDASKSENMNRAPSFFTTTQTADKEFTHETLKLRNEELAHNTIPVEEVPKWRPGKGALMEVCISNLKAIASQVFLTISGHLPEYTWRVLSAFTRQVAFLVRKLDLQSKTLANHGITLEKLNKLFYCLLRTFQLFKFDSHHFHGDTLDLQMKQVENTLAELLDLVQRFQRFYKIPLELPRLRRVSLYFDETNLSILRKTMENSGKFQSDIKPYVNNSYYKNILKGRVEMEVESRELTYGVARSFIKIFQKMQMRGDLPRFEKLEQSIRHMFEQHYTFVNAQQQSIHANEHYKFLLSIHTNYFYNDLFRRASVIFELLLIEVPEIRYAIYSEHLKNYMILKFFSNKQGNLKMAHPSMKNLYDLSINLSGYCFRSQLLNDSFGVIHSRFFHTISLLNNFTLENFHKYKEVSFKIGYYDTNISLYQSEENFFDEMFFFEREQTFIVSICCRLDTWLNNNGFHDKLKLGRLFNDDYLASTLPLLTTWIELLDSLVDQSRADVCQYVYNKLFLRYFLKILFGYDDMSNVNLIQFKKAIASLYFKIGTEDILENTLKYQFDMKSIYDSIIKITRIQFLALLDAQKPGSYSKKGQKKIVAATARERRRLRKQEEERESLSLIRSIGHFTQKNAYSRSHLFDPFAYERPITDPDVKSNNIILFGGSMFYSLEGQMGQVQYETKTNTGLDALISCYKTSDNRDLGFQFINSLVKILNKFEFTVGTRFWSSRKENARVYFEIEQTPLSEVKKFELKIVYLLSMMNKQIEVVNQSGQNILISFRKYPEIYTVNQLDPIKYMAEFHFEDFKRDTLKINSKLSNMTSIEYRIMQASGRFYKLICSDALRRYPYIPWYFNIALNILILANYINPDQSNSSEEVRYKGLETAIQVLGWVVLAISSFSLLVWLYTRFQTIRLANKYNFGAKPDADISSRRSHQTDTPIIIILRKLFSFIIDHPYFTFIMSIFGDTSAIILMIHIVVSILGLVVDQLSNGFGILTFVYTSSTAQNVLRSITTNIKPIIIALVWILLEVNFYTVIWFFNFYKYFDPAVFPDDGHPCHSLSSCYFTVINYGIRMGGGLGEVTRYVPESASNFETKILFDLTFFFFVNITGLNLIFGIIIDTFGQLREDANEKRSIMDTVCLVCGVHKTDFEASGINFQYHVKQQHNLSDYAAYLIRLQINKNRLTHDIDYKIKKHLDNLEVSWFPNRSTYFIRSLKNADKQVDDPVMVKLRRLEDTVASVEEALDKLENRVLIPTKTLVDDK